jgi:Xaa-Pro aminopeptidase
MSFQGKLKEVQLTLSEKKIDGWLLYDFQGSNSLATQFLEIPPEKMMTRRFFYWIPKQGEPIKIVSLIEPSTLDHLPGVKMLYRSWQDLERLIGALPLKGSQVAMEYSPCNALPTLSKVDGGTIDLIRQQGAEVVSSANLLQKCTSVWSSDQLHMHLAAAEALIEIANETWEWILHSIKQGIAINEHQVQCLMWDGMKKRGCKTEDPPICAVNAHAADPHYCPSSPSSSFIQSGDLILLDLWCKQDLPQAVYADITRVGVAASKGSSQQEEIFQIVKQARENATAYIREQYENNRPLLGWEVDQIARETIVQAGYGDFFIHRTGHHIGEQVHGPGANLDNLETQDFRELLPGTCFSVEPGIYLPQQFGIRLEYDVYLDPLRKVLITGGIQEALMHA